MPAEHQRVPHWEIGEPLGMLDMERGAKLSGSMFPLYRGAGARLLRALTAFALDRHADAYEEIRPPTLVLTETMTSTGHLPKFADEAYHVERDDLWAIPTAEVPLTSMHRDEILDEAALPLRYTAATPCFRREAGAAGRDTRACSASTSSTRSSSSPTPRPTRRPRSTPTSWPGRGLLRALGLRYRVLDLCTGDLGGSSARTFDLEVYAPGVDRWLEVSSVSWFRDYQARRANVRYRPAEGGPPVFVHTVNGSALAWARIWAALVENGRQPDGTVVLPECWPRTWAGRWSSPGRQPTAGDPRPGGRLSAGDVEAVADAPDGGDEDGVEGRPRCGTGAASRGRRASWCRRCSRTPRPGRSGRRG